MIRNIFRGPPPGYHGGDYGGAVPPMPHGDRGKKGVSWTPETTLHCAIIVNLTCICDQESSVIKLIPTLKLNYPFIIDEGLYLLALEKELSDS